MPYILAVTIFDICKLGQKSTLLGIWNSIWSWLTALKHNSDIIDHIDFNETNLKKMIVLFLFFTRQCTYVEAKQWSDFLVNVWQDRLNRLYDYNSFKIYSCLFRIPINNWFVALKYNHDFVEKVGSNEPILMTTMLFSIKSIMLTQKHNYC